MPELKVVDKPLTKVADFYHDKSVLVTGASGFFGSVLLEILLRCCPGIKCIYILIRPSKHFNPEERKEKILNKKIFKIVREKYQELLNKVHVIAGDVSCLDLKMNEEDIRLLLKEVSVVFHCASSTSFTQTLKGALQNNALSVHNVIEICRRMEKFEALIYTSTAYCNCNHVDFLLKEEVYRLPFHAESFLEALKNEDDGKLQELFNHCKPEWPNTYTFSKCLAENIIVDTASDMPIAIIRPSAIFSTWKHPIPGYEEGRSATGLFFFGAGKGLSIVLHADPNFILDFVPADVVANAHVLVAYCIGTKRCSSPTVFHCTASENFRVTISEYAKIAYEVALKFPSKQSFLMPTECIITSYKCMYYVFAAFHLYLPAILLDCMLRIFGQKSRIFSLCRALEAVILSCNFFGFHSFTFERENLNSLNKLIHPQDMEELPIDFRNAKFRETAFKIPESSPVYDCNTDETSTLKNQKFQYRCHFVMNCVQGMLLLIFILLPCWIVSLFF